MQDVQFDKRKAKAVFLFLLISFGFVIFIGALIYWVKADRDLPGLKTSEKISAIRGNILSADGYTIATSKKLYTVRVDARSIDDKKIDAFADLYSIYAKDNPKRIKKLIKKAKRSVVLSRKIDTNTAKQLRELSRKLYMMKFFTAYEHPKTKKPIISGISISENGEKRIYPNNDILSPFAGYISRGNDRKLRGEKGIENSYDYRLQPIQDAFLIGPKDTGRNVILNGDSKKNERIDGFDIVLSISVKLQKAIEKILDESKRELRSKEIVAGIIQSNTGAIVSLATSNRFNPNHIRKKDYRRLNPSATEYSYEPGSVIKPITLAILLREDKVNPYDLVNTHNGIYRLGKDIIRDSHSYQYLSVEDIIVHSSNIGILQIAQKLKPLEYYQGLKDFGFASKTGIDLPYEHAGKIPSPKEFRSKSYKATASYGYSMQTTFIQILRAYNAFNYKGRLVTPYMGVYLIDDKGKKHYMEKPPETQVLPISIAQRIKKILIKTVKKGTGKRADVEGLEIGGKTGTAQIAKKGGYGNSYNSSFIGFANDENNKFTVGVWVREPTKENYYYYGSKSAAPVFKKIVEEMVKEGYLTPKDTNQSK
ncbi:MAG: penicillin-binding protein [Proteobacteria bacterium]|nr:MAG: penicillin-binding protein [Pseudomonadota bacterium]